MTPKEVITELISFKPGERIELTFSDQKSAESFRVRLYRLKRELEKINSEVAESISITRYYNLGSYILLIIKNDCIEENVRVFRFED